MNIGGSAVKWSEGRITGTPPANQNLFSEAYWHTANYINQGNKEDWYRDKTEHSDHSLTL